MASVSVTYGTPIGRCQLQNGNQMEPIAGIVCVCERVYVPNECLFRAIKVNGTQPRQRRQTESNKGKQTTAYLMHQTNKQKKANLVDKYIYIYRN